MAQYDPRPATFIGPDDSLPTPETVKAIGRCCDNGYFGVPHDCQKQNTEAPKPTPARLWVCANPRCGGDVHERTVSVTVHDLWRCGDHDERPLTYATSTCSWACLAAVAQDIAANEPKAVGEPF